MAKLRDAGTIDHFGLAFQYQIKKIIKKNGQKQSQIKNTMKMQKGYMAAYAAHTTNKNTHLLTAQNTNKQEPEQRSLGGKEWAKSRKG